jgi:membrane associated rhomboid family serine protease
MGIYDRDYYQGPRQPGINLRGPSTAVGWIIAINVAIFILDAFSDPAGAGLRRVSWALSLNTDVLTQPWLWWKFLTCGFAHASYPAYQHILFNMLGLFFLGRMVEQRYGRKEFLWFYMVTIVFGSILWCALNAVQGNHAVLVGASGAITGVVMLFALNFPKVTILFMFIIPMPAWVLGVMLVVFNLFGMRGVGEDNVAYGVHLAGAGFALAYWQFRWNISRVVDPWIPRNLFKNRPKLRVHDPDDYGNNYGGFGGQGSPEDFTPSQPSRSELRQQAKMKRDEEEVDRILAKIHSQGADSLTSKERRTMEAASRRLRDRKRDD